MKRLDRIVIWRLVTTTTITVGNVYRKNEFDKYTKLPSSSKCLKVKKAYIVATAREISNTMVSGTILAYHSICKHRISIYSARILISR